MNGEDEEIKSNILNVDDVYNAHYLLWQNKTTELGKESEISQPGDRLPLLERSILGEEKIKSEVLLIDNARLSFRQDNATKEGIEYDIQHTTDAYSSVGHYSDPAYKLVKTEATDLVETFPAFELNSVKAEQTDSEIPTNSVSLGHNDYEELNIKTEIPDTDDKPLPFEQHNAHKEFPIPCIDCAFSPFGLNRNTEYKQIKNENRETVETLPTFELNDCKEEQIESEILTPKVTIGNNNSLIEVQVKIEIQDTDYLKPTTEEKETTDELECNVGQGTFKEINNTRKHTSSKIQYFCHFCDKKCSSPSHLAIHTRTHTGEKPYKCEICGKHFSSPSNLKAHLFIHSGKKPYKCKQCTQRFPLLNSLKKTYSDSYKAKTLFLYKML